MAKFSIESVFKAIDKVTAPVKKMTKATQSFGQKTAAAMKRATLSTNNYSKANSGMMKNLATLVGAGGLLFMLSTGLNSVKNANVELDASLQSLQAITGVIGEDFKPFAKQIEIISKKQKIFGADTAKAFELVGSAKPELLASADALGEVTESAVILGKAGKLGIEGAVNALTVSLNQFGEGADKAAEFVDILATAQQKGSGPINYLAKALVKSGGTMKSFGNSFEDTVAILEGFAKAGVPASESGTMLAGIMSKLSKVQQKEFNPQFTKAVDIIDNLKKANLSYSELMKLTDGEGAKWITTIMNQNDIIQELTGNLHEAGNAQKQADIQTASLQKRLDEVSASFKNATTSTDSQNENLKSLKDLLALVADNMDKIISVVIIAGKVFIAWAAYIVAVNAAMKVTAAMLAIGKFIRFVKIIAMMTKAKGAWVAIQWALNAAMTANPVGVIIVAIGALIGIIVLLVKHWRTVWDWLNQIFDNKWIRLAMTIFTPFIAIPLMIARNWETVKEVLATVWDAIKSGIKSVGLFIFEFLVTPIEMVLKLAASLGSDLAQKAIDQIGDIRVALGGEGVEEGDRTEIINRDAVFQQQQLQQQGSNVNLNINNNNGSDIGVQTAGAPIKVNNTSLF